MRLFSTALLATAAVVSAQSVGEHKNHDDHVDFVQMAAENGFASESFTVVTNDGYISQLYRIPGKAGDTSGKKPAVLMMHGMECDMNFWTANDA